jgi:hypothetical protein
MKSIRTKEALDCPASLQIDLTTPQWGGLHNLHFAKIIVANDGPAQVAHGERTIGFLLIPLTVFQNEQSDFYLAPD